MIHKLARKMNPTGLLAVGLVIIGVVFSRNSPPMETRANHSRLLEVFVIDGDTIKATLSGRSTSIRLIGLDAPETSDNERASKQASWWGCSIREINLVGERAKAKLKDLLKNQEVTIQFGDERTDRYGRTLGYIYIKRGGADYFVNRSLIASGLAKRLRAGDDDDLSPDLDRAELEAKRLGLGLWGKNSSCRF